MKGIIFDFNGTLFWDSKLHYDAWLEYSEKLRGTPFTPQEMREHMFGRTNDYIIEYALGSKPSAGIVLKYAQEKEAVYRKKCLQSPDMFKLAPGAEDFLDFLKDNNIPRAIATMSDWSNVEFYIKEFNLEKWFDTDKIVYSDGKIPSKPAPDIFLIAAQKTGLSPKDCIAAEDAVSGINAAKSAGIGLIIAVASMEPVEYYQNIAGVDRTIRNFNELERDLFEIPASC